ncbi:hypothetical protein ACLMJK_008756 [Lecanora helva]
MTDPLSITASVAGITTAAIQSVRFLRTTISDIKDVPTALGSIRDDLQAIEPVLQKLHTGLEGEDSRLILMGDIKAAVENCSFACSTFQKTLDHWTRHARKYKRFWAEWTDRFRIGMFEQGTINVFQGRLNDCKGTLNVILSTSSVLAVASQGLMMKEVKESMLKSNELRLEEEQARADRELARIESSMKQLSINMQAEVDKESKQNLGQLLEQMQEQKASNDVFRKTCEEALLKTKYAYDEIDQDIRNTGADDNSKAVAGLINMPGGAQNVKQIISDTSARGGSFAGAGILHGVDLQIPSSRD